MPGDERSSGGAAARKATALISVDGRKLFSGILFAPQQRHYI